MQKENEFFFSFSSESNFSKGESYKFYFTSAIRHQPSTFFLHTSDIFQANSVCKDTNKREQYKINTCFCFYCRAKVSSTKSKLINYFDIITRTDPVIHQMQVGATKLLLYLCALFYEFDKVIVYLITSNRYQFVSFYDKLNSCIVLVFSISPAKVRKKIEPTKR